MCLVLLVLVPGFEMNPGAGTDATHPFVALAGRVSGKVIGKVVQGQRIVQAIHRHAMAIAHQRTCNVMQS